MFIIQCGAVCAMPYRLRSFMLTSIQQSEPTQALLEIISPHKRDLLDKTLMVRRGHFAASLARPALIASGDIKILRIF